MSDTPAGRPKHPQKILTETVHHAHKQQLLSQATGDDKQRLESILSGPAHWLSVIPGYSTIFNMTSLEYRVAIITHLGLPVFPHDRPCNYCGTPYSSNKRFNDRYGLHAARCGSSSHGIHYKMCQTLLQAMRDVHFSVEDESKNLVDDSQKRPADILYHPIGNSPSICFDFSVVSFNSLRGIAGREQDKLKKYEQFIQANSGPLSRFKFVPIVMDSLGRFSSKTISLLSDIAKAQAVLAETKSGPHFGNLMKLMQFTLKKAIATAISCRLSKDASDFISYN